MTFNTYARTRPVVAPESPGFGSSDRSPSEYAAASMRNCIGHVLGHAWQTGFKLPADVLAASLSCELVARAASGMPPAPDAGRETKDKRGPRKLLEAGLWAHPSFRALTSEKSPR